MEKNIAVVGCGRISKKHFESIKSHSSNLELVAVCDLDKKVLLSHSKKYNVTYTLEPNIDVLFIIGNEFSRTGEC